MSAEVRNGLTFPDGLDEATVDALIEGILEGLDRDQLFADSRLTRVRHPLLEERMGKEVALNTEIHNLVMDIVTALSVSDRISNRSDMIANIPHIESILLDSAQDSEALRSSLDLLKNAVSRLVELNPEEEVQGLVAGQIRGKLAMPNAVQELILYPPVTALNLGESPEDARQTLEACRTHLFEALADKEDPESVALREAAEAEVAAIRAWFDSMAA